MTATTSASVQPGASSSIGDQLPGGLVIWIFVAVELVTFGAFFVAFAAAYAEDPDVFSASQTQLHPLTGTLNTAVLLTGSWMAARAVTALQSGRASRWFVATGVVGCVFLAIKTTEYVDVFGHGVTMSTNPFWFYYLFLTMMHYMHIVFGVGVMFYLAFLGRAGHRLAPLTAEAGAVYWHLVDLIWIALFPIIYLVHPA